MKGRANVVGTGQVARSLGMTEPQLQDMLRHRPDLAAPVVRGRRVWSPADVQRLRAHIGKGRSAAAQARAYADRMMKTLDDNEDDVP